MAKNKGFPEWKQTWKQTKAILNINVPDVGT
jgi:hypothetical protein